MVQGNVVAEPVIDSPVPMTATPIVGSSMAKVDEELEPVFQEPIANHEGEQQEPQGNVVAEPVIDSPVPMTATPIVGSSMAKVDEELEPVFQESIANHEGEQQEPPIQDVPHNEPPRRSQRARMSAISDD
jgi:hypothetical protein